MPPASEKQRTSLRGGKREVAGRKTAREEVDARDDYKRLLAAKADREEANAQRDLLRLRREAGELYERDQVLQVFATTVATFAEQMRSIPDMLERKAGLQPRQAELAAEEIDKQLEELKRRLMLVLEDADR
jgi:hypothetical protein